MQLPTKCVATESQQADHGPSEPGNPGNVGKNVGTAGTLSPVNVVQIVICKYDRTNGTAVVYTEQEKIVGTYNAGVTNGRKGFGALGNA